MTSPVRCSNWIVILPLGAVAAAYVAFFYLPGRRAIAETQQQVRGKQDFIAQASETRKAAHLASEELQRTKNYIKTSRQRLLAEKDLGAAFEKVHATAHAAGVHISRFEPQPSTTYERLRRVPCVIRCNGSFSQIYEFLRGVESQPTLTWIGPLRIEGGGKTGQTAQCELTLEFFAGNFDDSDYAKRSD